MTETPLTSPGMLPPDAFAPMRGTVEGHAITRPSLSYWQDAWIRLKANWRALFSLWLIVAMLAFVLVGPLVWRVDPAAQDLRQVSSAPGLARSAIIVAPFTAGAEEPPVPANRGLHLAAPPTTQVVRLVWQPVSGAADYLVYRNIVPVTPGKAYGLPLGNTMSASTTHYDDQLDLDPQTYYYTVIPVDADGRRLQEPDTIKVAVKSAITLAEAQERGLVGANDTPGVGDRVTLAWHPLGTDYLGRDMLARLMQGGRASLFIGLVAPLLYVMLGVAYGSVAGFIGGRVDQVMMRFADFVIALPFLLFMILLKVAFGIGPGESGIMPMIVAMVILLWPGTARLVRGQILQVREEGYVEAAKLLGARTSYIMLRHMIPNTLGVILVTLTFAIPSAIFTEAFLSFIGMGVAPPEASWGSMSNDGIKTMLTHPHELLFPALMISVTVLAFNLLGDGLRDALDARMRSRG
ncbi:MAG: ABC transporter permease [Novosphingobium sp.]|nr:ABC transporter permease [Novosphingobium sp.]